MTKRQKTRSSTSTAPTFHATDGSHVFTYSMNDPTLNGQKREEYRDTVNRLLTRQVLIPRRVDWNLLRSMSVENNIKVILEKHAYDEDGTEYYICHAWERVFDISETLYRELIVEFVATFRFDAIKALEEFYQSCMTIWRPWNGKVRKKARKREKCTKSTQKTLGDREVLILAPPSSTELQIRVDLSVWRRQVGSLAIARWSLDGANAEREDARRIANANRSQPECGECEANAHDNWRAVIEEMDGHLQQEVPEASSDDEDEEDGKQGGYTEFMIPKKEDKGKEKEKEKEKEKAPDDDLIYIAPIKHDPGSYNLPISCHKFSGLALVDSGAALNMMPVGYCRKMGVKRIVPTNYQYRGVNGYMTTPLGIAEGVPIRIGKFLYYTDFVIANLPQNTEIPIILGRSFLHTAQVNTDMRNQVTSLGYGDNRIYFDPNGEPVRHLDEPYDDPSLAYTKSTNRPLLPHELGNKTEDYSNPMHKKEQSTKEPGTSKKDHRKKRGSSSRRAKK
ncbi:hypothetical protein OSB04_023529 [Centaurea solstitialis]|uniref:Uncharacterized protein n=1 Tax=Centaurea solstitialis TaxID=347529 RepID=A0AA38T2W0_9ASTR|nr:hypothetical protein OSB04_023529 [Centaurea solstitialis]